VGYKGSEFRAERHAVAMVSNATRFGYLGTQPNIKSGAHMRSSSIVRIE